MLFGIGDDLLVKCEIDHFRRGIARIIKHQHFRLGVTVHHRLVQHGEKIITFLHRQMANGRAGNDETERMNRIGRIGHQYDIARIGDGLRHIGKAFLRTERGNDFRIGVKLDAKAALIITRLRLPQAGNTFRCRIAMGARITDRFHQFFDNMLRCRQIGVTHAEIDNILAIRARLRLQLVDALEHIRWQSIYAMKFVVHLSSIRLRASSAMQIRQ